MNYMNKLYTVKYMYLNITYKICDNKHMWGMTFTMQLMIVIQEYTSIDGGYHKIFKLVSTIVEIKFRTTHNFLLVFADIQNV